jgi:hypothetical protein
VRKIANKMKKNAKMFTNTLYGPENNSHKLDFKSCTGDKKNHDVKKNR